MITLEQILEAKRAWVAECRGRVGLADCRARAADRPPCRPFVPALRRPAGGEIRCIAEFKTRSPSRGEIRPGARPTEVARLYEAGGAAAISVLTDGPFFGGSLEDLEAVRAAVALPVLRKDFLIDPYQLYEARGHGADAVLLIAEALDGGQLQDLYGLARELGMGVLVEIHDAGSIPRVAGCEVVGINHRDLQAMRVDMATTERLLTRHRLRAAVGEGAVLVGESGVGSRAQVEAMAALGLDALLVGSALMGAPDIGAKLRELFPGATEGGE
jgi:indole-3-glycerol phosphate synthase